MHTKIEYTAEVGTARFTAGKLERDVPMLRIPLVNNTVIGIAADGEEQALCQGGGLLDMEGTQNLIGRVYFPSRVSYNGKKIIIPKTPEGVGNLNVSPVHGKLCLNDGGVVFYYRHLSKGGTFTSLLVPGKGVVASTNEEGAVMNLDIDISDGGSHLERILLLGGFGTMLRPESIREDYLFGFYHVTVIMTK